MYTAHDSHSRIRRHTAHGFFGTLKRKTGNSLLVTRKRNPTSYRKFAEKRPNTRSVNTRTIWITVKNRISKTKMFNRKRRSIVEYGGQRVRHFRAQIGRVDPIWTERSR